LTGGVEDIHRFRKSSIPSLDGPKFFLFLPLSQSFRVANSFMALLADRYQLPAFPPIFANVGIAQGKLRITSHMLYVVYQYSSAVFAALLALLAFPVIPFQNFPALF